MSIASVNPATGQTEKSFLPYTSEEVEQRVAAASTAHTVLRASSFAERAAHLFAAADLLDRDLDSTARLLTAEMGKPLGQAEAEVRKCAKGLRFYAAEAQGFLADQDLADPSAVGASRAGARWEPLGVVLAVMPWNFPLWQVLRFVAPALMAGNACLLKHAANVPRSALYLQDLIAAAGFPVGSLQTLLIEVGQVEAVIADPRVSAVTLTGSEAAGRAVASMAAGHVKKTVLELGGSDPFIVMPTADVASAAQTAVASRLTNNGQSCIGAKRFIVHEDVYETFRDLFVAGMDSAVVGDPMQPATQVGPLATEAIRQELADLVDDARARGASILTGGNAKPGPGFYYPPTVVADLSPGMRLVLEEAFGPVASLYQTHDRAEALLLANQTSFGLSSALWTSSPDDEEYFTRGLRSGAVFINGMSVSYPELPFGGIKASGYGRELGAEGIREFCSLKTVWKS